MGMIISCKIGLNVKNVKSGEKLNFKLKKMIAFIANIPTKSAIKNRKYLKTIQFFDFENSQS